MDLRKGADGLRALVGEAEQGVLYLFSNRTRALLKFLSVDSTGVFCGTRRLHHRGAPSRWLLDHRENRSLRTRER